MESWTKGISSGGGNVLKLGVVKTHVINEEQNGQIRYFRARAIN